MRPVESTDNGALIRLYVAPRASATRVVGVHDGRVKLQVAAPPVDGKANKAIVRFLSKKLRVPKGSIGWRSGESSKHKTLIVTGVGAGDVASALGLEIAP